MSAVAPVAPTQPNPHEPSDDGAQLDLRRAAEVAGQFEMDNPPVAESWRMRNQLTSVFDSLASRGVNLENVECHYRLCRMQLLFKNVNADIDILRDLFVKAKSPEINQFGQVIAPERDYLADGKVRTIVYIAREGTIDLSE